MAYADIGGMLFFAYVMHTILMWVVSSIVVSNDSRLLGGARQSYDNVGGGARQAYDTIG